MGVVGEAVAKSKPWPNTPRGVSGRLRRAATFLRNVGIEIAFMREGQSRTRTIRITTTQGNPAPEYAGERPSAPSAPSASTPNINTANGFATPRQRTVPEGADGRADGSGRCDSPTVRDGADANSRTQLSGKTGIAGWSGRI